MFRKYFLLSQQFHFRMLRIVKYIFFALGIFATMSLNAQQYLVVQKRGTLKNFKYEVGDELSLQTKKGDFHIKGTISRIGDSTLTIDNLYDIHLSNIARVFRLRSFLNGLSKIFFIRGGIAYVSIVGINGAINNDSPMIDEQTLIISAGMVATGFAIKPFIVKKMSIPEKWELKVLDFNKLEGEW